MLKQTTIFLDDRHMAALKVIGKAQGSNSTAPLVRRAIWEFIRREKRAQAAQVVVPGRKNRRAVLLG
jgi:hypothetical protein